MPRININETETEQLATFDVTENTVLIPLLYARKFSSLEGDYEYIDDASSRRFTNVKDFKNWLSSGGGYRGNGPRYVHIGEADQSFKLDGSYVMAYELLQQGMNVVIKPIMFDNGAYWRSNQTVVPFEDAQKIIEEAIVEKGAYEEFKDRNNFNLKFITSGAYPNLGVVRYEEDSEGVHPISSAMHTAISKIAEARADSVALFDLREDINSEIELLAELNNVQPEEQDIYSASFFPWATFKTSAEGLNEVEYSLPAGFAYLMAYANSVKNNANWFAASGVIRGYVPKMVKPNFKVGEHLMHILQGEENYTIGEVSKTLSVRINSIMDTGSYGNRIWGNRVYKPKVSEAVKDQYREFLNVRILICDIKKQVYHAAMRTSFEPNDDIVWINFKTLSGTLLDKMKSGRGLKWYKWEKEKSESLATIQAKLWIIPIEAVEAFDINVILTSEEVNVNEE